MANSDGTKRNIYTVG